MLQLREITSSLSHLLFPHTCSGCGTDLLDQHNTLCIRCMASLPATGFEWHENNPVERIFYGRLPLRSASAQFYFTKGSLMQQLMHQFKYKGNKELGLQLGHIMGEQLMQSGRFGADALVPLPLFTSKERRRGYNQAAILCDGMAQVMKLPVLGRAITRPRHTDTQTRKGRIDRWQNIEGKFIVKDPGEIAGKHIILVDDVITTGATIESCGTALLGVNDITLSIVALCFASRI